MKKKKKDILGVQAAESLDTVAPQKKVGRPLVHKKGRVAKTMVTLDNNDVVDLDIMLSEMRRNTGTILDRGLLLRALTRFLLRSNIDITRATNQKDIEEILLKEIK